MLRVSNLEKSIAFYTHILNMRLLRTFHQPEEKYRLAFLGYGDESEHAVLELTYNENVNSYDLGNAFGHIAIAVNDCHVACEGISKKGGLIVRPPGPLKGSNEIIAFISDPDGYSIELIQQE